MTRRALLLSQLSGAALEEALEIERRNEFALAWNANTQARQAGKRDLRLSKREEKLGRELYCKKCKEG